MPDDLRPDAEPWPDDPPATDTPGTWLGAVLLTLAVLAGIVIGRLTA
jgi:hypothetical protein